MRIANTQVLNQTLPLQTQITILQTQVDKIFTCLQGRVSFGTGVDGIQGQNVDGEWQQFTTSGTPNAENTIAHTIGSIPLGYLIVWRDKAAHLYQGPTTGTAWTSSNIYLKCDVATVTFLTFLIKKGSSFS